MIRELLFELYSVSRDMIGKGSILVLYVAAVIAMVILVREGGKRILPAILSIPAVTASAVALAIEKVSALPAKSRFVKIIATAFAASLCLLAVSSSGRAVFSRELCERAENDMHLPGGIMQAMMVMLRSGDDLTVLAPYDWTPYFDSYSSMFRPIFEDPSLKDADKEVLRTELDDIRPDMKKITSIAKRAGCRYVLLPDGIWPEVPITKCGYELVEECDGCRLYREVRSPE